MFESEEKKTLKTKYNKMTSISANTRQNMKNIGSISYKADQFTMPGSKGGLAPPGSVYGELKLSEKLSNELLIVKQIVDRLQEDLEEAEYYRD